MTKLIVEQGESIPFSLYLIKKDGQPIIIRQWVLPWGYNCETKEEGARPMFDIIKLKDVTGDDDLDSFVQAVISDTHNTHPLSEEFRTERDRQRLKQCHEAAEERKMKGKY